MTAGGWLAALLLVAAPGAADPPAAPTERLAAASFAPWYGHWIGEGTAFGQPATATLLIGPGRRTGTTRLYYALGVEGTRPLNYFAEAVYRVDANRRVSGDWTDSLDQKRPVGGRLEAGLWAVHWGSADREIGRSTYRLESDGSLTVSDSTLQHDGSWRLFATLRYRRTSR